MAELGRSPEPTCLSTISERSRCEAQAVECLFLWRSGAKARASEALIQVLDLLHSDPWVMGSVIDGIVRCAIEMLQTNPDIAGDIYERTVAPFAMYRMNEARLALRFLSADRLGGEAFIETLEAFEPSPLWNGATLEKRARAYERAGHPLAEPARRELRQFRAWAVGRN